MMTKEQRVALLAWLVEEDRSAIYDLLIQLPPGSIVKSDGTYLYPSRTNHGRVVSYTESGEVSVYCEGGPLGPVRGFCDPKHLEIVEYSATPDEMRVMIILAGAGVRTLNARPIGTA